MTVVIGTAGHIDHGKTTLLRALTGIDADRLPEERRRGMTIDVGYAHLALDDGTELDFVDVPGHDKLVGNMLVGAGEIDAALLVVAADDGPRAQTLEHLALLDALGIARRRRGRHQDRRRGSERVAAVRRGRPRDARRDDARRRRRSCPSRGVTGDGIDALRVGPDRRPRRGPGPVGRTAPRPTEAGDRPGLLGQGPRDRRDRHAARRSAGTWRVAAGRPGRSPCACPRAAGARGRRVDSRPRPDGTEPGGHRRGVAASRAGADGGPGRRRPARACSSAWHARCPTGHGHASTWARPRSTPRSGAAGAMPSTCPTGRPPRSCGWPSHSRWPRATVSCCAARAVPIRSSAARCSTSIRHARSRAAARPSSGWAAWPTRSRRATPQRPGPRGSTCTARPSSMAQSRSRPTSTEAAEAAALASVTDAPGSEASLAAVRTAVARTIRRAAAVRREDAAAGCDGHARCPGPCRSPGP